MTHHNLASCEPAAAISDTGELDLTGYESSAAEPSPAPQLESGPSSGPKASPTLIALYRIHAAALQMIANADERESAAARERLRLDQKLQASTHFDWVRP